MDSKGQPKQQQYYPLAPFSNNPQIRWKNRKHRKPIMMYYAATNMALN